MEKNNNIFLTRHFNHTMIIFKLRKDHSMIETRRLKNFVIFSQTFLSFVLSRKLSFYKNLYGCINYHHLLNRYVLHNFFAFLSNAINCLEQLKTIQKTEKKKKCNLFLRVCIMPLIALCETISKQKYSFKVLLFVKMRFR